MANPDRIERMAAALDKHFPALSRDHECFAAYSAERIKDYRDAEHAAAIEEALLSRCFVANAAKQLAPDAGEGEV